MSIIIINIISETIIMHHQQQNQGPLLQDNDTCIGIEYAKMFQIRGE